MEVLKVGSVVRFNVSRPGGVLTRTGTVLKLYPTTVLIGPKMPPWDVVSVRIADVVKGK